jgi:hypothetical protein
LLTTRSGSVSSYCGKILLDRLRNFENQNEIIEHNRVVINRTFNTASLVTPPVRLKLSKFPKYLRPVQSACTTLVNKLQSEQYYELTQEIFFTKFY